MSFCPSAEPTKPRLCALSQPHLEGKAAPSVKGPARQHARFAAQHVGVPPSVRVGDFCGRFPSIPVDATSLASRRQAPGWARPHVPAWDRRADGKETALPAALLPAAASRPGSIGHEQAVRTPSRAVAPLVPAAPRLGGFHLWDPFQHGMLSDSVIVPPSRAGEGTVKPMLNVPVCQVYFKGAWDSLSTFC